MLPKPGAALCFAPSPSSPPTGEKSLFARVIAEPVAAPAGVLQDVQEEGESQNLHFGAG